MTTAGGAGGTVGTGGDGAVADRRWLAAAIDLSRRCPPSNTAYSVGAIIVDADGRQVAAGYSRENHDAHVHAEESALAKLPPGTDLSEATLYSSLEPCTVRASRPRTCTQLVIDAGVGRVVFAWREPSVLVADCRGAEDLTLAGVEVVEIPEMSGSVVDANRHLLRG